MTKKAGTLSGFFCGDELPLAQGITPSGITKVRNNAECINNNTSKVPERQKQRSATQSCRQTSKCIELKWVML